MEDSIQVWKSHSHLYRRLQKTFYYGHTHKPIRECSSLPLAEVTVDMIEKTIARQRKSLDNLDVNYAAHILHQACISPASILIAMIYLERLKASNSHYLQQASPCELFLVSLVVASKFLFDKGEDEIIYNDEWAEFGNFDIEDLNRIEREFLSALNWSCYVDHKSFMEELIKFEAMVSFNEYLKRSNSNMTYTEVIALFDYFRYFKNNDLAWNDLTDFAKSIFICSLAYFAALGVLFLSFSIVFSLNQAINSQQHQFGLSDNFTLYSFNLNSIAIDLSSPPLKSAPIKTSSLQPINDSESLDQTNYNLLLKHRYKKLIKCS